MKERILAFFDPARSIPLFIIGTAALTLVLQALYDYVSEPGQWKGGYWLAIVALGVTAAALTLLYVKRPASGRVGIHEEQKPAKRKGLILLASPREGSAPAAIEYHLPELTHCWIVATQASLHTAANLEQAYHTRLRVHQGSDYVVDEDRIESTYDCVERIIEREARSLGLSTSDLIADITGGVKPMTAGMTLACLARQCDAQYMKTLRNEQGQVMADTLPEPIRIDLQFLPDGGRRKQNDELHKRTGGLAERDRE